MIRQKLLFLLIIILPNIANSQSAYSNLDKLYADFVKCLKDSNPQKLKEYCYKVTPDKATIAYMKKNNFSYRGLPEQVVKKRIKLSTIAEDYYKAVLRFKEKLKNNNQLQNLKYVGRDNNKEIIFNKKLNIYFTETFIILESDGDTIQYKLGEMFKINYRWKSFTLPKAPFGS